MMRFAICVAAPLLVLSTLSAAQKTKSPPPKPLDQLESAIGQLDEGGQPGKDASQELLVEQMTEMQVRLDKLDRELAEKSSAIQQLEDENEKLRQALRLRFGNSAEGLPPVPIPNRDLIESVLEEPPPFTERNATSGAAGGAEEYTVVGEWGRSPDVAASLPGQVTSLIGLALAVPGGMSERSLAELGRDLRKNYDAYDNINIEVFDDVAAARRFANEGTVEAPRRVMSISKFRHSGRDSIVTYRGGKPVTAP
jgi:hypothetical protein